MYDYYYIEEKMHKVYEYIVGIYGADKFNNIELEVTNDEFERSRYSYKVDNNERVISGKIILNVECTPDEFITEHFSKEFGLNLPNDYMIHLIRTLGHEIGHHLTVEQFDDEAYINDLSYIESAYKYGTKERKRAYRMIPEEHMADEISANILKNHLNILLSL